MPAGAALAAVLSLLLVLFPPAVASAAGSLTGLGWSISTPVASARGATYTYYLTLATSDSLTATEVSLPAGTTSSGTLAESVTAYSGGSSPYKISVTTGTPTLSGTTLTLPMSAYFPSGSTVTIQVTGLVNSPTAGSYAATLSTYASGTLVDEGTTAAIGLAPSALSDVFAYPSTELASASASYSVQFTTDASGASNLSSISFSVPPGTGFTPPASSAISVSPPSLEGGTASLSGDVVTYSFSSTSIGPSQVVSLTIPGFANASLTGSYLGDVATYSGTTPVDAGALPSLSIASSTLTTVGWSASATTTSATGATYTYSFTVATSGSLTLLTMGLPPGTSGTPSLGAVTAEAPNNGYAISVTTGTPSISNGVLSVPFAGSFPSGSTVSLAVGGLTNTPTPGSYVAAVTTWNGAAAIDSGIATAVSFAAGALSGVLLDLTSTKEGATGVDYTYSFTVPAGVPFDELEFSVPSGTAGSPALGTVTPSSIAGWSLSPSSLAGGTTLLSLEPSSPSTVTFSSATAVSVELTGLTNTSTETSFAGNVTALDNGTVEASGTAPTVTISSTVLTNVSWSPSSTVTSTPDVNFTWTFTTASTATLDQFTMTVPPGTSVTGGGSNVPVGTISAKTTYSITMASPTASLSGSTITFGFTAVDFPAGTVVSIELTGLTNTATAGNYSSTITTYTGTAPVDTGSSGTVFFTSAGLASLSLTTSATSAGATNVTYTYKFTLSSGTINQISVTVPPGTAGTPAVGTVTPSAIAGWNVSSISGDTITYTEPGSSSETFTSSTAISIQLTGLTNTLTPGQYATTITVLDAGAAIASGSVPAVSITSTGLKSVTWSTSSSTTSSPDTQYTYDFTTGSSQNLSSVEMSVPSGTAASGGGSALSVVSVSAQSSYTITIANPTASLSGGLIYFDFTSVYCPSGTAFTITLGGVTNTATAGNYASTVTTFNGTSAVDSGTSPFLNFASVELNSLSWTATSTTVGTSSSYTFSFAVSGTTAIQELEMTVPQGTSGSSMGLGTVTPSALAGSTQYSFDSATDVISYIPPSPPVDVSSSQTISLTFTGLSNTTTAGSYTSNVSVIGSSGTVLAAGTTPVVTFTSNQLSSVSWKANSTQTGATGVDYTYQFTTASSHSLTSVQMSVPSGTGGSSLSMGPVSANESSGTALSLGTISPSLSGGVLTLSFASIYVPSGTAFSLQVDGFVNTSSPGIYSSSITTYDSTTAYDSGSSSSLSFSSSVLGSPTWSLTNSGTGSSSQYSYSFGYPDPEPITSITMTVPSGTVATSPTVVSASPASIAGGTVSLSGSTLTYTIGSGSGDVAAGSTVSLVIGGITNTTTAGSYSSTITALDDGTATASGATSSVGITSAVLSNVVWSPATETAAATGASYTYSFTTGSQATLTGVLVGVPPGTGGSLSVGSVSPSSLSGVSVSFVSGQNEIQFSFGAVSIAAGTSISLQVNGVTNTATPGSYSESIETLDSTVTVASGTTGSVTFYASSVTLTPPSSLSWQTSLDAVTQTVVDSSSADQQYTVTDDTGKNAGWNVEIAATTFTDGSHSLSDSGTFLTNGSTTSPTSSSGPSATCISTCTAPTNAVSYPLQITTGSSPASFVIFSAASGTGSGSFLIGGSSNPGPVGWWVTVPANAYAGTYTSIMTFSIASGP